MLLHCVAYLHRFELSNIVIAVRYTLSFNVCLDDDVAKQQFHVPPEMLCSHEFETRYPLLQELTDGYSWPIDQSESSICNNG